MTGLPAGDTVYYRLVANNTLGASNGAIKQFVTHEGPVATTGDATEIAETSARLNGTVNPKGTYDVVPLRVRADKRAGHELSRAVSGSRDEQCGGVAGVDCLPAGSPLYYRLVANNTWGTSSGEIKQFTTLGGGPGPTLLVNGGFESGTSPWKFYQNGTGNAFSVVTTAPVPEGAYKARIVLGSTIGTNNQLYQNDLTLEANTAYRITFDYHASASTSFRVRVIEQNDDYTVYGFAFRYVYPTTSVQTYTLDFTTANFTGTVNDAMLQFYFVGGTPSRTIYLDNIVIRKQGAAPPLVATQLVFGTQPSNTLAGGVITPAVTVRITDAGGNLVTTDTRDVTVAIGTNPAAGTLGGTQTVAAVGGVATFSTLTIDNLGTGYTLVASASGLTGATSVPFNITTTPPPSANLVVNGGFESGTSPWKFYHNGTGNAFSVVTTAPVPEGAYKARIVLGSTIGTNNQLYQKGLTLEANTAYRITFDYHASASTSFRVRVIEQNDDYTVYGFAFRYVYPTTSVQTYTLDFTTANFTGTVNDAMLQFYFVGGTASRTIYLDNIVITKTG